ncbi:MAG: ferric reductase-like transmembrane domain-containing protein [Anaerolineaceae bacterium]|nr:ferric reductase-like transmembrane domain-containing protein [Anaerolineaceae bacterium]
MKKKIRTFLWLFTYFLMIFLPIILLMIFPHTEKRGFLREAAVAIGFIAMSLLGLQLIPTARLRVLTRTFDMDMIYDVHHKLSVVTFITILFHPILLFIDGVPLRLLNIFTGSWRPRAGVLAIVSILILIVTSVWRKPIKLRYDIWRWIHNIMSIVAIGFALYHMFQVNHYLSLTYQRVIWLSLTGLWVLIILYVRLIKPLIRVKKPYEVVSIHPERGSSWSIELKPKNHKGLKFLAGQFGWLTKDSPLAFRDNPFSFSTNADRTDGSFGFTVKELGDFTKTVKDLKPGDKVYVDGPYGTFSLDEHEHKNIVFIAGGIGSAPVIGMLRTMASRQIKSPIFFFYGSPSWDEVIYREELDKLITQLDLEVIHILEKTHTGWEGESGYITQEILKTHLPEDYRECTYFLCGPLPMLNAAETYLNYLGVSHKHIFSEKYEMA